MHLACTSFDHHHMQNDAHAEPIGVYPHGRPQLVLAAAVTTVVTTSQTQSAEMTQKSIILVCRAPTKCAFAERRRKAANRASRRSWTALEKAVSITSTHRRYCCYGQLWATGVVDSPSY